MARTQSRKETTPMLTQPRDIQFRAEPWLLLREMTHRVCNEYASVICSISRAAARATNDEARLALAEAADRLYEHASVHRALQMPMGETAEISSYLRNLCRALCRSRLRDNGIRLTLIEEPFVLASEQCWRVGLIVFELVTKAAERAIGGMGGNIQIECVAEPDRVLCRVSDAGLLSSDLTHGRGNEIISILAEQLGGEVVARVGPCGTTVILAFSRKAPVSRPPRTPAESSGSERACCNVAQASR
jgi:two-component sensor histidine kinase